VSLTHPVARYLYDLPPELVATRPCAERDGSRMMVVERTTGTITHAKFRDFPDWLRKGDLVALNDSRVIKARLLTPDAKTEIFLLEPLGENRWKCLVRPGRKLRPGRSLPIAGTTARVLDVLPDGERIVAFDETPDLETFGHLPLPPYFHRPSDATDDERYQTVYASTKGSVAAPTAGLHFTPDVLTRIPHAFLTLHVGAGTFLPVKAEDVSGHTMHEERFDIPESTAAALNAAQRIVAVGTTVTRTLESRPPGPIAAGSGRTDIFIYPPFAFRRVGALLTNFHLPCSTLLMLVCAFAGYDTTLRAYAQAVENRYRFFSYGDCMLIV